MYDGVFFNDTATTEIYTLSLHDALPICHLRHDPGGPPCRRGREGHPRGGRRPARGAPHEGREQPAPHPPARGRLRSRGPDRKSTRLNSSHANISYAVFCLKKTTNVSAIA